jgi:hypothetical protein
MTKSTSNMRPLDELIVGIREDLLAAAQHESQREKLELRASRAWDAAAEERSQATRCYRAAGEKMLEAKAQVGHGGFKDWIAANFTSISYRQAARYMRLVKSDPGSHLKSVKEAERRNRKPRQQKAHAPRAAAEVGAQPEPPAAEPSAKRRRFLDGDAECDGSGGIDYSGLPPIEAKYSPPAVEPPVAPAPPEPQPEASVSADMDADMRRLLNAVHAIPSLAIRRKLDELAKRDDVPPGRGNIGSALAYAASRLREYVEKVCPGEFEPAPPLVSAQAQAQSPEPPRPVKGAWWEQSPEQIAADMLAHLTPDAIWKIFGIVSDKLKAQQAAKAA